MTMLASHESNFRLTKYPELDARFWTFHLANPHVYEELVRLSRELLAAGEKRSSIGFLIYVVRYNSLVRTDQGTSPFKIDQKHAKRYAVLIMQREADLAGFFRLKREDET